MYFTSSGPGSVVGIATGYGLDGPGIESRWEARFSAPVQACPGAHPASCTMGTGSFPGVKSGRGMTLTPHPLLVPWSRKSRAIPLLPLWAVRPVQSLSCLYKGAFYLFTFFSQDASVTVHRRDDKEEEFTEFRDLERDGLVPRLGQGNVLLCKAPRPALEHTANLQSNRYCHLITCPQTYNCSSVTT